MDLALKSALVGARVSRRRLITKAGRFGRRQLRVLARHKDQKPPFEFGTKFARQFGGWWEQNLH